MCGDQGGDYDLHLWLYTTVMTLQGKELLEKGPLLFINLVFYNTRIKISFCSKVMNKIHGKYFPIKIEF